MKNQRQEIIKQLHYNADEGWYYLAEDKYANIFAELKVGKRSKSEGDKSIWTMNHEEYSYLVSCLDAEASIIAEAYMKMSAKEIDRSVFYTWMRKKGKFLKRISADHDEATIFEVYQNSQKYGEGLYQYILQLCQSSDKITEQLLYQKNINKIAIIHNRDFVIMDCI